jgi:hypothetical protein
MAAGIAAIPAGIIYAQIAISGRENWWNVLSVLAFGCLSAHLGWTLASRALAQVAKQEPQVPVAPALAFVLEAGGKGTSRPEPDAPRASQHPFGDWIFGAAALLSWIIGGVFFLTKFLLR